MYQVQTPLYKCVCSLGKSLSKFEFLGPGKTVLTPLSCRCNAIKAEAGDRLPGLREQLHVWRAGQRDQKNRAATSSQLGSMAPGLSPKRDIGYLLLAHMRVADKAELT